VARMARLWLGGSLDCSLAARLGSLVVRLRLDDPLDVTRLAYARFSSLVVQLAKINMHGF